MVKVDTLQPDLVPNTLARILVATRPPHLPQAAQDLNMEAKDGEELILKNPAIRLHHLQAPLLEVQHIQEDLLVEVTVRLPGDLLVEATVQILEDLCLKQTMEMTSQLTLRAILVLLTAPWEPDMAVLLLTEDLVDIHM